MIRSLSARLPVSGIVFGSLRQWHWISSALCLVGMILFAFTGITLNHAADIKAEPVTVTLETELSATLLKTLSGRSAGPLPLALRQWLLQEHSISVPAADAEWQGNEVYLGMPRPGGDAWLSIETDSGVLLYERTERGWISYLNDLHKGRNTGPLWSWFINIFSLLCLVFSLSGLWLLVRYARQRPSTWPLVALGVVIPLLIIILSVH
ncbi:PepSY-associated TM helix domain-containing protein [Thalassolituus sp. ST750PaO-4]|uniref:PepSY-associated TM helix domain-containing protein n=1 Tax=Thalassolituus sp. ST750PaO-4 TaxID=2742965 RepID=UPI001CE2435C|nr:PepSY-associated TM helix domain-containing protein [Thalassolituus sp. ST750PaO-4]MCA6060784.1 PepSY-associated TM helix domain-containing protein [Thalassolituus sp. ST750PaO-4]